MSGTPIPRAARDHDHEDWQVAPSADGDYLCAACGARVRRDEMKTYWVTVDDRDWSEIETEGRTREDSDITRLEAEVETLRALVILAADLLNGARSGMTDPGLAATWGRQRKQITNAAIDLREQAKI